MISGYQFTTVTPNQLLFMWYWNTVITLLLFVQMKLKIHKCQNLNLIILQILCTWYKMVCRCAKYTRENLVPITHVIHSVHIDTRITEADTECFWVSTEHYWVIPGTRSPLCLCRSWTEWCLRSAYPGRLTPIVWIWGSQIRSHIFCRIQWRPCICPGYTNID